jgi:hypothetical protein
VVYAISVTLVRCEVFRWDECRWAAALKSELDDLAAQGTAASDADLIAQIPYAPGLLAEAPAGIQEARYAALGIHCTFRADKKQVTIRAVLTDTTPGIVAAPLAAPAADGDSSKRSPETFDDAVGAGGATETSIEAQALLAARARGHRHLAAEPLVLVDLPAGSDEHEVVGDAGHPVAHWLLG